jgi:hypothetical protein
VTSKILQGAKLEEGKTMKNVLEKTKMSNRPMFESEIMMKREELKRDAPSNATNESKTEEHVFFLRTSEID